MSHLTLSVANRRPVPLILGDLMGLLVIQGLLLAVTCVVSRSDVGDLRTQLAWLWFLLPGWFLSSWWTRRHAPIAVRYMHAVIGAIGIHGCLLGICSLVGLGFAGFYFALAAVTAAILFWWLRHVIRHPRAQRLRLERGDWLVWIAVMILVVSIYRQPRSNDIIQFSLQQQDMTAHRSLQPSAIGMAAMGINEAMPRWRSHLWHLVPSVIADVTSLPVDGVLRRWAPIPIAFSVVAVLMTVIQRLAGRRVPLWVVALAVFGPVLLWYRSYNAFNYSFRLTNNFCLDKDLCLFLVLPSAIYLGIRWIRGMDRSLLPGLLLVPAIVKFHPMTSVYLVLLIPMVVIGYDRKGWSGSFSIRHPVGSPGSAWTRRLIPSRRSMQWSLFCLVLFAVVFSLGDAQTAHEQISGIVRMDWRDHQTGRPLHYWVGHYADIQGHDLMLDTSRWVDGRLSLRSRVLWNCGLLAAMHGAWLIWLFAAVTGFAKGPEIRRLWAYTIVLLMLWGMWWVSPWFLTWKPHYLAGYERLHWFAFVPALIAVASAIWVVFRMIATRMTATDSTQPVMTQRGARLSASLCAIAVVSLLLYSAMVFRMHQTTIWTAVRGLNSLLDFELPDQIKREQSYDPDSVHRDLLSSRPDYLRETDRVLFLDNRGNDQYWLIRQGVFWSEPYAEAYAWRQRGDEFLEDRRYFYDLLDRQPVKGIDQWLSRKGVTLVVDRRPGADMYLGAMTEQNDLGLRRIRPGVWRRLAPTRSQTDQANPMEALSPR